MQTHFSSFTPEAMRAMGRELETQYERRREFVQDTKRQVVALLADFRDTLRNTESDRQRDAASDADSRRLFVSELRSGVHALKNRFELGRTALTDDLRQMSNELRAASEAFRSRQRR